MLKTLIIGFCIGLTTAVGSMLIHLIFNVVFASWTLWIWPSSVFLIGTAGAEHSSFAIMTLAIAILLNGIIYLGVAFVFWKLILERHA
jgi:hypothetical protein